MTHRHHQHHYYGDTVRRLFLVAGLLMLASGPFFRSVIPVPAFVAALAVLIVGLAAGLINPRQRWTVAIDTIIALVGMVVFEYYALISYGNTSVAFFWVNQALALLFFLALYFSTKTLRSKFLPERRVQLERRAVDLPEPKPAKLTDEQKSREENWFI